jgi:hypothetical protein
MLTAQKVRAFEKPIARQNYFRSRTRAPERGIVADAMDKS